MRLIIVGGDKVTYYLVGQLSEKNIDITVIESRLEVCQRLANDTEVKVLHGDGTSRHVLEEARCQSADMFIALTGKDENNLVACQLAKHDFSVRTTIAKLNNPKNEAAFKLYGVDMIHSATEILADMIDWDIEYAGMRVAYSIPGNTKYMVELDLSPRSDAVGKTLQEYQFPVHATVALITRNDTGETIMPAGHIRLHANDHLLIVCDKEDFDELWRSLVK